jgi:hypothetical protein
VYRSPEEAQRLLPTCFLHKQRDLDAIVDFELVKEARDVAAAYGWRASGVGNVLSAALVAAKLPSRASASADRVPGSAV